MAWQNATLGDLCPEQLAAAQTAVVDIQAKIDELTPLQTVIDDAFSAAQALVTSAEALLDDLEASGLHCISLTPDDVSWSARLAAAANAPSRSATLYTAVVAMLVSAVDGGDASDAYENIKNSLKTVAKKPALTPSGMALTVPVAQSTPEWMPEGAWVGQSIRDMFPGTAAAAEAKVNDARLVLTAAQSKKASFDAALSALGDALIEAQAVIDGMGESGVYTLTLAPAQGDWLARMLAESGKPPDDSAHFSGGSVIVISAVSEAQVLEIYNKVVGML